MQLAVDLINKRQFERFNVLSLPELTIRMEGVKGSWLLVCLGNGGCGLFTPIKNAPNRFPPMCRFHIRWPKVLIEPLVTEGRLVFFTRKRLEKKSVWYVGFEFTEEGRLMLEPLVERLSELTNRGELETFLR